MKHFIFWPQEASLGAQNIDHAFLWILLISTIIGTIVTSLIIIFAIRYRRASKAKRGPLPKIMQRDIELGWTSGTLFLAIFIFWWFVGGFQNSPSSNSEALEIHILAKQWMWKVEHPNGAREIDALHIPNNTPIRLVMTSQDVIHSFYVPAFRIKQDVLPGRNTQLEFTPDKIGEYHLFCAEFCGTRHSHMTGEVVVMTPSAYARWTEQQPQDNPMDRAGERLYAKLGCGTCHAATSQIKAPRLDHLYGSLVHLADGRSIEADRNYLRKAIVSPAEEIVAGYDPIMPSYAGLTKADDIEALIAYLKSLTVKDTP